MVYLYRILNEFFLLTCTGFHQKWITWDGWKVKKKKYYKIPGKYQIRFYLLVSFSSLTINFFLQNTSRENK